MRFDKKIFKNILLIEDIKKKQIIFLWFFFLIFIPISGYIIKGYDTDTIYNLGKDSSRFLSLADSIINKEFQDNKSMYYFSYAFFLSIFKFFNLNLNYVVVIQCVLTLIASIYLLKIADLLKIKNTNIILILFLFYFPIQLRNFYILSDLLFIDLSIITTYFFLAKKNIKNTFLFTILCLFTIAARPHGIIFTFFIVFYYFEIIRTLSKLYSNIFLTLFILICFLFLNNYLKGSTREYFFISGEVIFGYEALKFSFENLPQNITEKSAFYQITFILINYPLETFKLFFFKFFYFISGIRPYYSIYHNIYEIIFTLFIFLFSLPCMFKNLSKEKISIIFIIIVSILGALITGPDWSGRYRLYMMPFIFLIFSENLNFITGQIKK